VQGSRPVNNEPENQRGEVLPMYQRKQSNMYIATNPYCPPIGTASSDDAPFIFKSSKEFPAGDED
jgi:hypothetical protein